MSPHHIGGTGDTMVTTQVQSLPQSSEPGGGGPQRREQEVIVRQAERCSDGVGGIRDAGRGLQSSDMRLRMNTLDCEGGS